MKATATIKHDKVIIMAQGRERMTFHLDGSINTWTMPQAAPKTQARYREIALAAVEAAKHADPSIAVKALPRQGAYSVVWYYYRDGGRDFAAGHGAHNYATVSTHSDRDEALNEARKLIAGGYYISVGLHLRNKLVVNFEPGREEAV